MISSQEAKCYIQERDCFCLDETELLWRRADESAEAKQLLILHNLRSEVMHLCHEIPSSGHQGIQINNRAIKAAVLLVANGKGH